MKKQFTALLFGLIVSISSVAETAPNFELKDRSGKLVSLTDYRGKVILLDFWASWCIPCRASFPWMNTMQKKHQSSGFEVVTINLDQDLAEKKRFLEQFEANFTVLGDQNGITPSAYKVLGMPTSLIIDRQGNIVYRHIGYKESDADDYEKIILKTLDDREK